MNALMNIRTLHKRLSAIRLRAGAMVAVGVLLSACMDAGTPVASGDAVNRGLAAFQEVCMGSAPNYDGDRVLNQFRGAQGYNIAWAPDPNVTQHADGGLAGQGLFGIGGSSGVGCLVYVPSRDVDALAEAVATAAANRMPTKSDPIAAQLNSFRDDNGDVYVLAKDRTGAEHIIVISYKPEFQGQTLRQTLLMIAPRSAFPGA